MDLYTIPRSVISAVWTSPAELWPVGQNRLELHGDISEAHAHDPAKTLDVVLQASATNVDANFRLWAGFGWRGSPSPTAGSPKAYFTTPPPAGWFVRLRVTPAASGVDVGCVVKAFA